MLRNTRYAACITMYSSTLQKCIEVTLSYNYNIVIHAAYQKGFDHAVHCSFPETIRAALYTPANTPRGAPYSRVLDSVLRKARRTMVRWRSRGTAHTVSTCSASCLSEALVKRGCSLLLERVCGLFGAHKRYLEQRQACKGR